MFLSSFLNQSILMIINYKLICTAGERTFQHPQVQTRYTVFESIIMKKIFKKAYRIHTHTLINFLLFFVLFIYIDNISCV